MHKALPRPLTDAEKAVVDCMIRAAGEPLSAPSQVVAACECGCATVDFIDDTSGAHVARDAIGRTPAGIEVGALLWAKNGITAGLEIYMFGTDTADLPVPETLQFEPFAPAS